MGLVIRVIVSFRVSIRLIAVQQFSFLKYRSNKKLFPYRHPALDGASWCVDDQEAMLCNERVVTMESQLMLDPGTLRSSLAT